MAKQKQAQAAASDTIEDAPDEPSSLAESTHAELLMMYNECALSIRFAKSKQWQSMGGILLLFLVLGIYAAFNHDSPFTLKATLAISLPASIGGIYSLVIYQFWQGNERERLVYISNRLSSTFRTVRAITNPREADFHRYVLLFFMMFSILAGNLLLIMYVMPKIQSLSS